MTKLLLVLFLSVNLYATEKDPGLHRTGWDFKGLGTLPIQAGGRVKPLDAFARESVLFITGSQKFKSWDSTELLFSWFSFPRFWETQDFIEINRKDLKKQLGLDESKKYFSPHLLVVDSFLSQYAQTLSPSASQNVTQTPVGAKPDPREQELRRVFEKLTLFRNIINGIAWTSIPPQWDSLAAESKDGELIRRGYAHLIVAYQESNQEEFSKVLSGLKTDLKYENKLLNTESDYLRLRPFLKAWMIYLIAALAGVGAFLKKKNYSRISLGLLLFGFAMHIYGFTLRCIIAGRPPVSNMYESIIWVSLGVVFFSIILFLINKKQILITVAGVVASLLLILADAAPTMMDPHISPLVPVLRSNYWLTIHVLTITLSYAAFALASGISNVTLFSFLRHKPMAQIEMLNLLTYRALQFGVVLLAAGTILGGVWADESWGRFWGWDPKEVWALIALLCYLAVLHARFTGWVGVFTFPIWCIVSFMSVVMAWYGVNFVLGQGLHSYGFSSGGQFTVGGLLLVQLLFVLFVYFNKKFKTKNN